MKNDKQIYESVKDLKENCETFLSTVKAYGNQCAQTDRMLETVLETAEKIKFLYGSEFGEKQPVHYSHINDCWRALEKCSYISEVEELFKEFPRWSGDWEWFYDNGTFCVKNDYSDEGTGMEDYEIREIENLSSNCDGEVYWEILYNEKEYNEERTIHYDDFDDARADFKLFTEEEPEYYNYVVLREVVYNEDDGSESREELESWGLDGKEEEEVK